MESSVAERTVEPGEDAIALKRIGGMSPVVIGSRLRRARLRKRISIRDLAALAKISKNSVLRLEQGLGTHGRTVHKVCTALDVDLSRLADENDSLSEEPAVHLASDDVWVDLNNIFGPPLGPKGSVTPLQRKKLGRSGLSPLLMLQSRLQEGLIRPSVIELFEATPTRAHIGEEFVYVLQGKVRIVVGSQAYDLGAGDSITFWSSEPHRYEPNKADLPARLLIVQSIDSDIVALF